ncbi:peptidylprolyl isomerase [Fusarium albosuccineum]|uniref:peptidylprolyl isomerase n=1 Tax=Fusarium albosuccineum TaxID=1237068 RepID=A0A8H4KZ23_9HYPO|nr:peptidylprolyl isomerase [Fusarium albosuccineum]
MIAEASPAELNRRLAVHARLLSKMRPFSFASISRASRITRPSLFTTPQTRNFSFTQAIMGVTKTTHQEGSGAIPQVGQTVTIEYTGYLKDASKPDNKGEKFDSSVGRGDFVVPIGIGRVIKGWDEGVTQMKVGEKATLDITPDYGYGAAGFPGHIPPNASLIFDVELKKVQ